MKPWRISQFEEIYSGILISQTLSFFKPPDDFNKPKVVSPSTDKHSNFTRNFSNYLILEPILVSLGGSKNRNFTVQIISMLSLKLSNTRQQLKGDRRKSQPLSNTITANTLKLPGLVIHCNQLSFYIFETIWQHLTNFQYLNWEEVWEERVIRMGGGGGGN